MYTPFLEADSLPPEILDLCLKLRDTSSEIDQRQTWPSEQLGWLRDAGVYRWFIPKAYGGDEWDEAQILAGYLALSQSCLTTTFVLTQWNAACKRILGSDNQALKEELLPAMADGSLFATVGISHLTTSRQHLGKPVLLAEPSQDGGYLLQGFSPWVTGAHWADVIVLGATLPNATQIIAAVPTKAEGLTASPGASLVALSASCTDSVELDAVTISESRVLAGPVANVMQTNSGGGAGGLQTSTLAVGLSLAATGFLKEHAEHRPDLAPVASKLEQDTHALVTALRCLSLSAACDINASQLRQRANSLVLRSTQAALSAAKGAGFIATHPTGRWAREALFFLVWSCPQPVVNASMCELAQLSEQ